MENKTISTKTLITIGITISLIAGFLDVVIGLTSTRSELLLLRSILLPLTLTTALSFISFIICWYVIGKNISKALNLREIPLAAAFGVFIIASIVLFSFNYNTISMSYSMMSYSIEFLLKLAIIVAIALVALIISYFAMREIKESDATNKLGTIISLLLPVLILELLIFIWFSKSGTLSAYITSLGFIIVVILTCVLYSRFSLKLVTNFQILLFISVLIGSPLGFFISRDSLGSNTEVTQDSSNNKINNIILISIDTLRTDVLSSYGSTEVSTPNIDKIANDGILFTQAYSPAPWTLPALSSIMTGVNPLVHKTTNPKSRLPEAFTTIAEYLAGSGFKTGAIGRNVFLHSEYNIDQGFMEYNFFPKRNELVHSFGGAFIRVAFPEHFRTYASTTDLTNLSVEWINDNQDIDFFFWVHYFDPHLPYTPPLEYIVEDDNESDVGNNLKDAALIRKGHYSPNRAERKRIKELYDAEVRYVDDSIGKLLETLEELDLYKDSLIIITSDHGEEFWEHNGFEHGHTLYNELIKVPLIVKLPDNKNTDIIDVPVTTQSILPTILDIAKIDYKNGSYLASSLVPLLENNLSEYEIKPIISSSLLYYEDRESAIFDENKYIRTIITDREEFFNLDKDPGEQYPLSNSKVSDKITQAQEILQQHKDESLKSGTYYGIEKSEKVELDKEKKEKLKALDYIQ